MLSEAQARITINKMLEDAGWRFLPDGKGRRENIICEHRVTRRVFSPSQDLGADFEHAPHGFVDYLLLNTDQRPVVVVEAKKESIDPLSAKEQARAYAESLGVSHIFLSNGLVHYYWNLRQGNPVKVSRFLPLEQLGKAAEWRPDSARLFDFFANCAYFEEDFDYDLKLTLPKGEPPVEPPGGRGGGIRVDDFTNTSPDPIAGVLHDEIGLFGMRIDREMYRERFAQQASEAVASDAVLRRAYDDEDWPAVEERVRRLLFEKPQEF